MISDVGKLTSDWNGVKSVVLYGAGIVGNICKTLFDKVEIEIPYVIDKSVEKQEKGWNGIPVISFEEAKDNYSLKSYKIVVMAGHDAYGNISNFLEEKGLVEFEDFCNIGQFMSEWLWNEKKMNCVFHVDMTITTICTLNCRHCNLFIPYHKRTLHFELNEMKENVDLFFERIDYVAYFGLIGGETFLNPILEELIEYIGSNYSKQIGRLTVVTNGTVTPKDSLLIAIKKYNMYLSVSDYTDTVPYAKKIDDLETRAKELEIDYFRNSSIKWTDFGFPDHLINRTPEQLRAHLKSCRPNWNALHGGKFYYCNVAWSAEQSGHFNLQQEDYIELCKIDPNNKKECRRIVELSRGTSSFCKICGGCGKDNTNYVPTGVQMTGEQKCIMENLLKR